MIRVVCAIIRDSQNRLLVVKRSSRMEHSYLWEFPGGKVEKNETDFEAISREIEEELGLRVEGKVSLDTVHWTYSNKKIALVPIICEIRSGEISLEEHDKYAWISTSTLKKQNLLDADRVLLDQLVE